MKKMLLQMKTKILNLLIIISSFFGYLEWGKNNSSFLYKGELEVLSKLFTNPIAAAHPLTLIPLLGQLLLLFTIFQAKPSKRFTYIGIISLGCLLCFITFIGIIDKNLKMLISTLPFIIFSVLAIRELAHEKHNSKK